MAAFHKNHTFCSKRFSDWLLVHRMRGGSKDDVTSLLVVIDTLWPWVTCIFLPLA